MNRPSENTMLSDLLEHTTGALDITPEQYELAVQRYEHLGAWFVEHAAGEPEVYPQGSFRLGTMVRPEPNADFDIDLVFWRDLQKKSVTQAELRDQAGALLVEYIEECGPAVGVQKLEEKGRCWTLVFGEEGFHMDVLPVIPDAEEDSETAVLLSDRDLRNWQHSNPIGYADWFWKRMGPTVEQGRIALASFLNRDVQDVPHWRVRTPLQRVVQVIKRDRDLYFADHPEDQPASILLTTLAARAYDGQTDVLAALTGIVEAMPQFIETRPDGLWVPNPAHPEENFADKWRDHPDRKQHFDSWLSAIARGVESWPAKQGFDEVVSTVSASLGAELVKRAAAAVGAQFREVAAAGGLGVSSTGRVSSDLAATTPVRRHNFHGG